MTDIGRITHEAAKRVLVEQGWQDHAFVAGRHIGTSIDHRVIYECWVCHFWDYKHSPDMTSWGDLPESRQAYFAAIERAVSTDQEAEIERLQKAVEELEDIEMTPATLDREQAWALCPLRTRYEVPTKDAFMDGYEAASQRYQSVVEAARAVMEDLSGVLVTRVESTGLWRGFDSQGDGVYEEPYGGHPLAAALDALAAALDGLVGS